MSYCLMASTAKKKKIVYVFFKHKNETFNFYKIPSLEYILMVTQKIPVSLPRPLPVLFSYCNNYIVTEKYCPTRGCQI